MYEYVSLAKWKNLSENSNIQLVSQTCFHRIHRSIHSKFFFLQKHQKISSFVFKEMQVFENQSIFSLEIMRLVCRNKKIRQNLKIKFKINFKC